MSSPCDLPLAPRLHTLVTINFGIIVNLIFNSKVNTSLRKNVFGPKRGEAPARFFATFSPTVFQKYKTPKLSRQKLFTRKNFPDEVRDAVSHDKPKKRVFASHDIAKERVFNVL